MTTVSLRVHGSGLLLGSVKIRRLNWLNAAHLVTWKANREEKGQDGIDLKCPERFYISK